MPYQDRIYAISQEDLFCSWNLWRSVNNISMLNEHQWTFNMLKEDRCLLVTYILHILFALSIFQIGHKHISLIDLLRVEVKIGETSSMFMLEKEAWNTYSWVLFCGMSTRQQDKQKATVYWCTFWLKFAIYRSFLAKNLFIRSAYTRFAGRNCRKFCKMCVTNLSSFSNS